MAMMMHSFLLSSNMSWISPIEHLMSLMASVIHDVGHDGVNNMFHTKAQTMVALRYNDRSVLATWPDGLGQTPPVGWVKMQR